MLAIEITGPGAVEARERRRPRIRDDADAIVRVTTCAIGPRDIFRFRGPDPCPGLVPGAEFCGVIDEVGGDVRTVDLGDLVAGSGEFGWNGLDGAQALYVRAPDADASLVKVPTAALEERALLLPDTFGRAREAARLATEHSKGPVAVLGCDPAGASSLVALAAMDVAGVVAIDHEERRLGLAKLLGAAALDYGAGAFGDAAAGATGGRLFGSAIVGAGAEADWLSLAARLIAEDGLIVMSGPSTGEEPAPVDPPGPQAVVRAPRPDRETMAGMVLDLWGGRLDLGPLVSHVMPLTDAGEAYRLVAENARGVHKVLLKI